MILWDLLKLHTETQDDIEYVIFMGGGKEVYPLDLIPYACLIEKISMWEIETRPENVICMKIWLETK